MKISPESTSGIKQSSVLCVMMAVIMAISLSGCVKVVKPVLPTGEDFNLPKAKLILKYPYLDQYDLYAQFLIRTELIDVSYVIEQWGEPNSSKMSWWNVIPTVILLQPAFWYHWEKGRYNVDMYYERPLLRGWQPLGIRLDFQEKEGQNLRN